MLIAGLVGVVFIMLSALHVYWALGGQWGAQAAIPQLPTRCGTAWVKALNPGKGSTLAVAAVLACIATLVGWRAGLLGAANDHWALRSVIGLLATIMLARAIGEFRLVGFFKTVKGSLFARMDTLFFSPLCVLLGLGLASLAKG